MACRWRRYARRPALLQEPLSGASARALAEQDRARLLAGGAIGLAPPRRVGRELRAHADVDPVERIGPGALFEHDRYFQPFGVGQQSSSMGYRVTAVRLVASVGSRKLASPAMKRPLSRWGRRSFPCIAADLAAARRYIGDRKLPLGEQADQTGRKRRAPNLISRYSRGDRVRKRRASRSERPEWERPSCA